MAAEMKIPLQVTLEIARSEGFSAAFNRVLDRAAERARLRSLQRLDLSDGSRVFTGSAPPVLNLSPIPPSPRRGGSQIQMLDRLEREATLRPIAMAYPKNGTLAVEVRTTEGHGVFTLDMASGLEAAVESAARLVAARVVHIENLHGLPFELIGNLEDGGLRTVVTIHDFTFFCRRPHLIDATTGTFCDYSTDPDQCRACLRNGKQPPPHSLTEYRRSATHALRRASALIFPSEFLRSTHRDLFPYGGPRPIEEEIPPSTSATAFKVNSTTGRRAIGFVGGCYLHKGGALIPPVVDRLRSFHPGITAHVYGNGEPYLTRQVRRLKGVRVRGYYRQGRLPALLAQDGIVVAVLPSIWPEAYALVVDECLASGVRVVAFDLGAVGERLRAWNTGRLVPSDEGAEGLARAVLECLADPRPVPRAVIDRLPKPVDAAGRHIALYRRLASD